MGDRQQQGHELVGDFAGADDLLWAAQSGELTRMGPVRVGRSGLIGLEPVLGGVEDIAFVHLTRRDVVRHKIVADIVDAYEVAEGRAGSTQ